MYRRHRRRNNSIPSPLLELEAQKSALLVDMKSEMAPNDPNRRSASSSLSCVSTDSGRGSTLDTSSSKIVPTHAELCSRADLEISDLSIPLAWNSNDYFRNRESGPSYSMFVVLKTKTSIIDSQIVDNVRRSDSDVTFDETFLFRNEACDFVIHMQLFAARNESHSTSQQTISQFLSRSLGRKFATSLNDDHRFGTVAAVSASNSALNNSDRSSFTLIAEGTLTFKHLSFESKVYDIRKLCSESNRTPPLYGNFCCRFVARPKSLTKCLASGVVTIKALDQNRLLQNVSCRLQRGMLRCFINNSRHHNNVHEQTLLQLVVNEETKVKRLASSNSLQIETITETGTERFIVTTDSVKVADAWLHALNVQVADCVIWGEFALTPFIRSKHTTFESAATLSKLSGIRLYDQIGVGTEKKPLPSHLPSRTAPAHRQKERPHLQDLFEPPYVKPYTYVLKLNVGEQEEIPVGQPKYSHQSRVQQSATIANAPSPQQRGYYFETKPSSSTYENGSATLPRLRSATVSNFSEVSQARPTSYFYDGYADDHYLRSREKSSRSHRADFRPLKELKKRLRKSLTSLIDRKVEVTKL
uniref:Anillin domain-containing protein n=1 Tax=Steinernema glaseri TaxID=37863 RepID=A0A1I8A4F5_9BILA